MDALLERGHSVHYLAVMPFPVIHPHCHFHRFPWPRNKTERLPFWIAFHFLAPLVLIFLGIRYRIDRVFAFGANYGFLLQPVRLIKRTSLCLFLRADNIRNHALKGRSRFLLVTERLIEGLGIHDARVHAVSDALKEATIERHRFFEPQSSGILPNNIERVGELNDHPIRYSLPVRLACVGILEKRKNQRFLLELMERIRPEQAQLYLYGIGPDEKLLKQMSQEKRLMKSVHFMGWLAERDIWTNVDLLLTPSLHEGAPNAVLEAMARGIPVLASDIPEHREILPPESLISPHSELLWLQRLQKLIGKPNMELQKMSETQFRYAKRLQFDWNEIICKHILNP